MSKLLKYLVIIVPLLFLTLPIAAEAAPTIQNFTNIAPFVNDKYDDGTTTPSQEWFHVFTKILCLSGDCRSVWPTGGGSGTVSTSSSETAGFIPFWTTTNATPALLSGGTSNFVWDNTNNRLGIGTSSPAHELDIVTSGTSVQDILGFNSSIGQASEEPGMLFSDTRTGFSPSNFARISAFGGSSFTNSTLTLWTADSSKVLQRRLTITNIGNVGIATTSPVTQLSVQGNALFSGNLQVAAITATSTLTLSALTGTQCLHEISGVVSGTGSDCGSGGSNFFTNSGNSTYLSTGSNLGIGTVTPFSALSVSTTSQSAPTTPLFTVASTTGATLITVLGNGWVGIGTSSPETTLTVQSNSTGDGTPALTIDGSGLSNGNGDLELEAGLSSTAEANIDYTRQGAEQWQLGIQNGGGSTGNDFELWDGSNNPVFTVNHTSLDVNVGTTTCQGETEFCIWGDNGASSAILQAVSNASTTVLVATNAGSVGIGTSSPSAELTVSSGEDYLSHAPSTLFAIASSSAGTATSTLFRVDSSGHVAVGPNVGTPTHELVVGTDLGTLSFAGPLLTVGSTTQNSGIAVGQGSSNNGQFMWKRNATAGNATLDINTFSFANTIRLDGLTLLLQTQTNKNVGIGTTSPYANLSVMVGDSFASLAPSTAFAIGSSTAGTATTTLFSVKSDGTIFANALATGFVQSTNGTLSSSALTSGNITTALGFTPFGGTSPLPIANGGTATTTLIANGITYYDSTNSRLANTSGFTYNGIAGANAAVAIGTSTNVSALDVLHGSAPVVTFGNSNASGGAEERLVGSRPNGTFSYAQLTLRTRENNASGVSGAPTADAVIGAYQDVANLDATNIVFSTTPTAGSLTEAMRITSLGLVGIGTTSPYAALSVVGSTGVVADHYIATSTTQQSYIVGGLTVGDATLSRNTYQLTSVGTNNTTAFGDLGIMGDVNLGTTDGNTIGFQHGQMASGGAVQTTAGWDWRGDSHTNGAQSTSIVFETRNAGSFGARLTINFNGNIGIGTTTPAWPLQVAGTRPSLAISDNGAATNFKHWLLTSEGGNLYIGTTTDLYATSTVPAVTINKNGYVGISTSTPWRTFSVNGTQSWTGLTSASGGNAVCIGTANDVENAGTQACTISSIRFKQNVQPLSGTTALSILKNVDGYSYDYKTSYYSPEDSPHGYGPIAEYVAKTHPELVDFKYDGTPGDIFWNKLTGLNTDAINELQVEINNIQTGKTVRSVEENWQWGAIGLLILWNLYLTFRKEKWTPTIK